MGYDFVISMLMFVLRDTGRLMNTTLANTPVHVVHFQPAPSVQRAQL